MRVKESKFFESFKFPDITNSNKPSPEIITLSSAKCNFSSLNIQVMKI